MPTAFCSVLNHLDQYNCGPGGICIDERGTPNRVKASQLVATGLSVVLSRSNGHGIHFRAEYGAELTTGSNDRGRHRFDVGAQEAEIEAAEGGSGVL